MILIALRLHRGRAALVAPSLQRNGFVDDMLHSRLKRGEVRFRLKNHDAVAAARDCVRCARDIGGIDVRRLRRAHAIEQSQAHAIARAHRSFVGKLQDAERQRFEQRLLALPNLRGDGFSSLEFAGVTRRLTLRIGTRRSEQRSEERACEGEDDDRGCLQHHRYPTETP